MYSFSAPLRIPPQFSSTHDSETRKSKINLLIFCDLLVLYLQILHSCGIGNGRSLGMKKKVKFLLLNHLISYSLVESELELLKLIIPTLINNNKQKA